MIEIRFGGWFGCRLATDPDPYDEPRGVSGYVHAYAGEPDLDRRIYLQPSGFARSLGPDVGVVVDAVAVDGAPAPDHGLLGAPVDLLDEPRFEGRNGVLAEDGLEPVYPIRLEIRTGAFAARRAVVPDDPAFPYPEFLAQGVEPALAEIRQATGIDDLALVWRERIRALQSALPSDEPDATAAHERLEFLRGQLSTGGGAARFFGARMRYQYELRSPLELTDPDDWMTPHIDPAASWHAEFWFGGWDADALCGYCRGILRAPGPGEVLDRTVAAPSTGETEGGPDRGGETDRRP